jgi:hypothetical protein
MPWRLRMTAMVSESMATQIAAIAMPDFIERMLNSSPDWTRDARAFNPVASRTAILLARLQIRRALPCLPAADTGIRQKAVNKSATFWQRR